MASEPLLPPGSRKKASVNKKGRGAQSMQSHTTNAPILFLGGHESMASLTRAIESESLWYVLRHGAEKRKQAEQLEFAVARLELFLREMQTHNMNYFALASIVVELSCMTDSPFDLVDMLHRETLSCLLSQPTRQELLEFYDEWAELFPEVNKPIFVAIPVEDLTLNDFGWISQDQGSNLDPDDARDHEYTAWFESKKDEVRKLIEEKIGHGSPFRTKWNKFPLMEWLIASAIGGATGRQNYAFVQLNTNFDKEPYKDSKFTLSQKLISKSPMAWVMLAETIMSSASDSARLLDVGSVKEYHKTFNMELMYKDLVMVLLPNFLAKLIRLKSVLNAQAVQASQTQTKVVATAASGFVALSNAVIAYFAKSHNPCSCE